jgi:subtilisin family serine protease
MIGLCALALIPSRTQAQRPDALAGKERPDAPAAGKLRRNAAAIKNQYIVVFNESVKRGQVGAEAENLARLHGGKIGYTYKNALRGFSVEMSEASAEALSRNPQVEFVEEDAEVQGASTQTNAPWPLDRLDQRNPTPNSSYNYESNGAGVNVYVIDSGIHYSHQEFNGRAAFAYDYLAGGTGADCFGHGTHVAGLIGGTTYGVAKGAKLWSVRVLDCSNLGSIARIIAGVDWTTGNHVKPAVANLSFITVANSPLNSTLDIAVKNLIASGVTTVVAAGNNTGDAGLRIPSRVPEAITVAATDQNDNRAPFSNTGSVVDVFAPGVDIVSAHSTGDAATQIRSGTSSSAPIVAGLAARYLSTRPGDAPDAVSQAIRNSATPGIVVNPGTGSPNLLAYAANTISDNFNDTARDESKWLAPIGTDFAVAEQNGRLEITPGATATGNGGYASATTVDLTDARISVEVSMPQLINNFASYLLLYSPTGEWIAFAAGGQVLMMRHAVNGVTQDTRVTYNPAQHRFWRIRHNRADDTVNWETSPDGVTWTTLHSMPRPFSITDLSTMLIAQKHEATTPTQTIAFDNLWHESNPTPAVAMADNFDDNSINPQMWTTVNATSPSAVTEQNGRIEVKPQPNTEGWDGLTLAGGFDFRDKTLQVEVQPATQAGAVYTYFKIYLDDNNSFVFSTGGGYYYYDAVVNGVVDRTMLPFDASIRFWRFRHDIDANTVSFETSADGATWTARKTVAVNFPIHSLVASMGAGEIGTANAAPGTATFDNFRLERYRPLFPLSDNFNDNARDAKKWSAPIAPDYTVVEQNGRLEITPAASSTNYDGYFSTTTVDLTDARVSVEGVSIPTLSNYGSYLILGDGLGNYLMFAVGGTYDNLVLVQDVGGVQTRAVFNYDAAAHRFWRIRHNRANDTVNWEVSPNNVTWTTLHSAPRQISLTNLQTLLLVRKYMATTPTGTSIFDNLRIERNEGGKAR